MPFINYVILVPLHEKTKIYKFLNLSIISFKPYKRLII
jgi:hypothetical protein